MLPRTQRLWSEQDRHPGDRQRLFAAVAAAVPAVSVLYPGSYVDVAASFVFPDVTYVDLDDRARRFFADDEGVREIIAAHQGAPGSESEPRFRFLAQDYRDPLPLPTESFDLLVSLYAGFVSRHCTDYLRPGGTLLANPSHGDVSLAALDDRYRLDGVVLARSGDYRVSREHLDRYLVPRRREPLTVDEVLARGRGVPYTTAAFAYVFRRVR